MIIFASTESAFLFIATVAEWRPVCVILAASQEPDGSLIPRRILTVYGTSAEFLPEEKLWKNDAA